MSKVFETKRPAILLLGAPGAGKGTQGKILGKIPRLFHCECGNVFRSLDTTTPLGKKFVEYSSRGQLVPDELTVELWKTQVANWSDMHSYKADIDYLVLDGIPRNVNQAKIMSEFIEVVQVFHLSCPDRTELAHRMRKRALKENRLDDANEIVVQKRISTYEAETKPILDYYCKSIVKDIDATKLPLQVLNDITSTILGLPGYQERASIS
jgi:adenylate kinase